VVAELVQQPRSRCAPIDQISSDRDSVGAARTSRASGLAAGLPKNLDAYSVVAPAHQPAAMTSAADAIALGEIDLAVVGGRRR